MFFWFQICRVGVCRVFVFSSFVLLVWWFGFRGVVVLGFFIVFGCGLPCCSAVVGGLYFVVVFGVLLCVWCVVVCGLVSCGVVWLSGFGVVCVGSCVRSCIWFLVGDVFVVLGSGFIVVYVACFFAYPWGFMMGGASIFMGGSLRPVLGVGVLLYIPLVC